MKHPITDAILSYWDNNRLRSDIEDFEDRYNRVVKKRDELIDAVNEVLAISHSCDVPNHVSRESFLLEKQRDIIFILKKVIEE